MTTNLKDPLAMFHVDGFQHLKDYRVQHLKDHAFVLVFEPSLKQAGKFTATLALRLLRTSRTSARKSFESGKDKL